MTVIGSLTTDEWRRATGPGIDRDGFWAIHVPGQMSVAIGFAGDTGVGISDEEAPAVIALLNDCLPPESPHKITGAMYDALRVCVVTAGRLAGADVVTPDVYRAAKEALAALGALMPPEPPA